MFTFIEFFVNIRFKMFSFALEFDIFITHISIVIHLTRIFFKSSLYKMNTKTNLLAEYVSFLDSTKQQYTYLWICTIKLVFILIILTSIRVVIHSWKLCDTYNCMSINT